MDGTELLTLATGVGSSLASFFVGLRVCGPRLQICWTERHPREIAEEIRTGQTTMSQLTEHSRRLVLAELARMNNGLSLEQSAEFITVTGVDGRFVGRQEPDWAHSRAEW
jgi:hypothetical protein